MRALRCLHATLATISIQHMLILPRGLADMPKNLWKGMQDYPYQSPTPPGMYLLSSMRAEVWVSFFLIPASCWFSVSIKGRGRRNSADQLTRHQNAWFAGPIGRIWTIYAKSSSSEGLPRILNLIVELIWAFFFNQLNFHGSSLFLNGVTIWLDVVWNWCWSSCCGRGFNSCVGA